MPVAASRKPRHHRNVLQYNLPCAPLPAKVPPKSSLSRFRIHKNLFLYFDLLLPHVECQGLPRVGQGSLMAQQTLWIPHEDEAIPGTGQEDVYTLRLVEETNLAMGGAAHERNNYNPGLLTLEVVDCGRTHSSALPLLRRSRLQARRLLCFN